MKKSVARKVISKNPKRNLSIRESKIKPKKNLSILMWILLGLIIISIVFLAYKASITGNATNGNLSEKAKTAAQKLFGSGDGSGIGFSEETKATISKLLLMVLLAVIVYSLAGMIPFFDKEFLKWMAAIVVAILSFIFVSADDIRYIAANYEAFGIVVTSVLPLIFIILFTIKFREAEWTRKDAFTVAISGWIIKGILIGFAIYCAAKWYILTFETPLIEGKVPTLVFLYPITLVAVLIWMFIEKKAFFKLNKERIITIIRRAHERGKLAGAREQDLEWQERVAAARTSKELEEIEKTTASWKK